MKEQAAIFLGKQLRSRVIHRFKDEIYNLGRREVHFLVLVAWDHRFESASDGFNKEHGTRG
jgi:hypothetical protein